MANRTLVSRVKEMLDKRNIDYETHHITFKNKGKEYQVFRLGSGKYRLNIIKGNQCVSEDYTRARGNDLIHKLIEEIEADKYDDEND